MNYLPDFRCVNKLIPLLSSARLVSSGNCSVVLHANVVKIPLIKVCCVLRWWQPASESDSSSFDLCCAVSFLFFRGCLVLMVSLTPACLVNTFCINSMLYLWILLRHCDCRESSCYCCCCYYCACCFVTFLKHFRLSEGLWLIDWS